MKEFVGYTGGRTAFNEDFENLRDLILSFTHIFDDCDKPFIITGCELSVNDDNCILSSGYVWLDGKIRNLSKKTISTSSDNPTVYIVQSDENGTIINYSSKNISGPITINYDTKVTTVKPNSGNYIAITKNDGNKNRMIDTFFDWLGLTKSTDKSQVINRNITFNDTIHLTELRFGDGQYGEIYVDQVHKCLTIQTYHNPSTKGNKYCLASDGVHCYDSSGNSVFFLGDGMTDNMYLPTVTTKSVNAKNINCSDILINGVSLYNFTNLATCWINIPTSWGRASSLWTMRIVNDVYIYGDFVYNELSIYKESDYEQEEHMCSWNTGLKVLWEPDDEMYFPIYTRKSKELVSPFATIVSLKIYLTSQYSKTIPDDDDETASNIIFKTPTPVFWHYTTNFITE